MRNYRCPLAAIFCVACKWHSMSRELRPNLVGKARVQLYEQKAEAVVARQGECIEACGPPAVVDAAHTAPRIARQSVAEKRRLADFSLHNGNIELSDVSIPNRGRKLLCTCPRLREYDDSRCVSVEPVQGAWRKRDRRGKLSTKKLERVRSEAFLSVVHEHAPGFMKGEQMSVLPEDLRSFFDHGRDKTWSGDERGGSRGEVFGSFVSTRGQQGFGQEYLDNLTFSQPVFGPYRVVVNLNIALTKKSINRRERHMA